MIAMPTKKVTNDICRLYNSEELYAWDCQTAAGCGRDWITPYRVVVKVSCVEASTGETGATRVAPLFT